MLHWLGNTVYVQWRGVVDDGAVAEVVECIAGDARSTVSRVLGWITVTVTITAAALILAAPVAAASAPAPPRAKATTPTTTFAVIGDYGMDNAAEAAVAALVASWSPAFVVTTGDNYYAPAGGTGTARYDASTGAHYCRWLRDIATTGTRCPAGQAPVNAFFPVLGNHDYSDATPGPDTYLAYFSLPGTGYANSSGNERYYDFRIGNLHFFALNSNAAEPDGTASTSKQAQWLRGQLAASNAQWKIVVDHHPPYSSDNVHGSNATLQWPFAQWGAHAVFSGHAHTYERIVRDGIVYFVNGLGGASPYGFTTPVTGSAVRHTGSYGAQRVVATGRYLDVEFYDTAGRLVDTHRLAAPPGVASAAPAALSFGAQSLQTTSWPLPVAIANTGGGDLAIASIAASGPFAVEHDCASLVPGEACVANVRFTPLAAGAASGTLTISADTGTTTVALTGTGERSLVTHYYQSILRRQPDSGGKSYWEGVAATMPAWGVSSNEVWRAMAMTFFASAEYSGFGRDDAAFVTDLYRTFFNRAPDAGGAAYWLAALAAGEPRDAVLVNFLFSAEFTAFNEAIFGHAASRAEVDLVIDFYRGMLARLPDEAGFRYWLDTIRRAQCTGPAAAATVADAMSRDFLASPECQARNRLNGGYVADLYNAFLRRGGDPAGVGYWIDQLDRGLLTREQERRRFRDSPEFQARIAAVIAQGCIDNAPNLQSP